MSVGSGGGGGAAAKKRSDYLSWDEYFMAVAFLAAKRSKDPSSQVGAVIVNEDKKIVGVGYNGMPIGCDDDKMPWARKAESVLDTKYPYVCHAEMNAILNKNEASVKGCTIYVALFPCNECAKLIIQSGIKHVVYLSDKYHRELPFVASRRLLTHAGITMTQFQPKMRRIVIDFEEILGVPEVASASAASAGPAAPSDSAAAGDARPPAAEDGSVSRQASAPLTGSAPTVGSDAQTASHEPAAGNKADEQAARGDGSAGGSAAAESDPSAASATAQLLTAQMTKAQASDESCALM